MLVSAKFLVLITAMAFLQDVPAPTQMSDQEKIAKAEEQMNLFFSKYDSNNDQKLDANEIWVLVKDQNQDAPEDMKNAILSMIMPKLDLNNDGYVTKIEYMVAFSQQK